MSTSSPLPSVLVSDSENPTLSSPLSDFSKTPSLPSSPDMPVDPAKRYPSPTSTTASGPHSPVKLGDPLSDDDSVSKPLDVSAQGPRPAKKRRISPPKERTTEYLDLMKPEEELTAEDHCQLEKLLATLRKKKKIVVIAGAGISVSAGIPDFRSSTGLFATVKSQHNLKGSGKHLFDASVYKHDSTTQSFHAMVREMDAMTKNAEPTPFHRLLASLAQEGRLLRLYSQNIDCIDTRMPPLATNVPLNPKGPWPVTIQLHGGLEKMVCTKCGNLEQFNGDVFDGPEAPLCRTCKDIDEVRTAHAGKRSHGIGRLRPRFVLYNEYNPDEEAIGNVSGADLKARPDAVLVVGTTLKVPGTRRIVKEMCQVTRGRKNGIAIWINVDDEPKGVDLKNCWDIVVRSKCDNVAQLAEIPEYCHIGNDYWISTEEDCKNQERLSKTTFAVNIPSSSSSVHSDVEDQQTAKPKQVEHMQGIPTPHASPKPAAKKPTKTKQTTISFADKLAAADKPAAAPKSRGRKRKALPNEVKNAKLQGFKPGKNITAHGKTTKPVSVVPGKRSATKEIHSPALPSLRPESKPSQENFPYKREGFSSPPTAAASKRKPDTISPKSIPLGYGKLID
ncbi:hypothetical protein F66182_8147 [Fusarium sp. NRRL 66182]|nr:hypothetical protein F66182_8147 [Fusarium sp. NRRL 66182]